MAPPHRALLEIAAGAAVRPVDDPDSLVASATEHGMAGLLWSRVRAGDLTLPRAHALQLAAADVAHRDHNLALAAALERAIALFNRIGVSAAAFKGVCAERRWYDRVGERPARDVDLLLAPGDVGRLGAAVDALDPTYPKRAGLDRRVTLGLQQAATVRLDGVSIDVHVEVPKLQVASRTTELVWRRVTSQRLDGGGHVPVLDAEGQLFAFVTHLLKDRFARLISYVDVVRVVEREDLDWEAVHRMTQDDGLDTLFRLAVEKVCSTLDRPLPPGWARARRGPPVWSVVYRPAALLTAPNPRPRRLVLLPLVIPGRRREVLRSLLRRVFPPRDVARDLYPNRSANPLARLRSTRLR